MLAHAPQGSMQACASENLTVRLRHHVPFGLVLFDERVGIGIHEPRERQMRSFVDTDAPAARSWAEAVFEKHCADAVAMPTFTEQGFRTAMSRL